MNNSLYSCSLSIINSDIKYFFDMVVVDNMHFDMSLVASMIIKLSFISFISE